LNAPRTDGINDVVNKPDEYQAYFRIAYGYNYMYIGGGSGIDLSFYYIPAKSNQIKDPSVKVCITDSYAANYDNFNGAYCMIGNWDPSSLNVHDRHSNGTNVLWVDGHADRMTAGKAEIQDAPDHKYLRRD
jgi:prepilin-type processing-associated H-X9-DG protein